MNETPPLEPAIRPLALAVLSLRNPTQPAKPQITTEATAAPASIAALLFWLPHLAVVVTYLGIWKDD